MLISQRISILISQLQETPLSFSEKLGIQRSSLSHLLSARNKPSVDFLEKLLHVFPQVNITWLLVGTGNMMKDESIPKQNEDNVYENEQQKFNPDSLSQDVVNQSTKTKIIQKMVCFYTDGTFEVYHPA